MKLGVWFLNLNYSNSHSIFASDIGFSPITYTEITFRGTSAYRRNNYNDH